MIDVERLLARVSILDPKDLDRWVAMAWVRPEIGDRGYLFQEIDVARVALIRDLIDGMRVGEEALPLVLSLLDQLYDARRRMREIGAALAELAPEELRLELLRRLAQSGSGPREA
jgi:chaperone modulatory protein CbpM